MSLIQKGIQIHSKKRYGKAAEISLNHCKYNEVEVRVYILMFKPIVFCLLLLALASAQNTFECSESVLQGIASGIINLGVPTASIAQTSYTQTLTNFNLGTWAQVFSAFAIAGFQGSSTQQYFSMVVENVIFNNGNTQMNFTMDYTSFEGDFTSTWSSIKLSWVAVSTAFETTDVGSGLGSYIWAGSVGTSTISGIGGAVMANSLWSNLPDITDSQCGYINTSPPYFDTNCAAAAAPAFITHLYIMGFKFSPNGGFSLGASALLNDGTDASIDESSTVFTTHNIGDVGLTTTLTGPNMILDRFSDQIQYIKVGIVITIILNLDSYPDPTTYAAGFQYSGIFMGYTLYNVEQPIIRTTPRTTVGGQNYNYFGLYVARYQIYGLSSFAISQLPSDVTVINYDVTLPRADTVLFNTDNVNYMSDVRISADQWSRRPDQLCGGSPNIVVMRNILQKHLATVPSIQNDLQNIYQISSTDLQFQYFASGSGLNEVASPLSNTVLFTNILYFEDITPGMAHRIDFVLAVIDPAAANAQNFTLTYSLKVEGNEIESGLAYDTVAATAAGGGLTNTLTRQFGYIFSSATPAIEISVNLPRGIDATQAVTDNLDRQFTTTITVSRYDLVFNPETDCCNSTCPADSGVILPTNAQYPPMCASCSAGLIYNSLTKSCQCQTGHYEVTNAATNEVQCFPCFAPLCEDCNETSRTVCNKCVTGASFDSNTICRCDNGFYQDGTKCTICPTKCQTCSTGNVCITCSNNETRSLSNNCACLTGYYDAGTAICATCPVLCKTCSSATECTTCFQENNRTLSSGQCVCRTGFYQVVLQNGTLVCEPCSPVCTSCALLPDHCTNCDANANRILGYDAQGNQVCNCKPGYTANSNDQCVQSNCVADPYCSTCLTVLGTSSCIKCIAATHRVLKLPEQTCVCQDGYYDRNGICLTCASGCAKCSNTTVCERCVVSATNSNDGSCKCPDGYFFTSTDTMRYCKQCPDYTLTCLSSTQALTCVANFQLVGGVCICPSGRYINSLGECAACVQGCSSCTSSTTCQACTVPLLLQGNSCVSRCGPGYYQNGYVCTACSQGCASCSGPNICTICLAGQLAYNGFCYNNCPAGSVASNSSSCVDCNTPCKTCTEHPSKCTSCQSCCGNLFNFKCLDTCPVGTYSINGTCQYCAYNCKSCLGSNTTCTSCPTGKILYNGYCYDQCPYIMIGGVCTFNCAKGLYKTAINECAKCDSNCATCEGVPQNCTSCVSGYASKGVCVSACPTNYLAIDGLCKPCNEECNGCINTCDNCVDCARGYYKLGSKCVQTCNPNMFIDNAANMCVTCNSKCKTCSSLTFCTTCANPQAVPVNGVCNDCSYPCNTCSNSPSTCTSCVSGFNLIGTTCIAACPTGAYPSNGVCVCQSGYIYSNQCVSNCPTGYGNVGGQCEKCADNCAGCEGTKNTCTSCVNGYALDQVTGICQKAPSCQFGQYYSQSSSSCTRICPSNTYFYENVCLTSCLSGYYDNGVGGCIASVPATGCSYPYFLSNGVCVSNCPSGTYPDNENRVCKTCSSNCFSCLTNTFCYACNAGYDLTNGICIAASITCPSGQYRYNGICYSACPTGTCAQGNFCQRTCPAGTWFYNGGCYRNCPTSLTTSDACVTTCPSGTSLVNGVCQVGSQACPSGQYRDTATATCKTCQYPCTQCEFTASYCTQCSAGLTLQDSMCVAAANNCGSGKYQTTSGACVDCPAKCAECISASICSSCASGYNFNGVDCTKTLAQLKKLTLTVKSSSKRGNTAYITICPNILPNGLSPQQQNNFFSVVPASADKANVAYVTQWLSTIDSGCVTVAINYNQFPVSSLVFLAVNAQLLASSYLSIGYSANADSYVSAAVNINLPDAPTTLYAPSNADFSQPSQLSNVATQYSRIFKSIEKSADILK